MRKIILLSTFLSLSANFVFSQTNTFPTTGNVGVGTLVPATKLAIQANANDDLISFQNSSGTIKAYIGTAISAGQMVPGSAVSDLIIRGNTQKILFSTDGGLTAHMTLGLDGNLGINTTVSPLEKIHIQNGNLVVTGNNSTNSIQGILKISTSSFPNAYAGIAGMTNGAGIDQLDLLFYTAFGSATEKMRIMSNSGFVGIGTSTPAAKLDVVNGNIFCDQKIAIGTTDLTKIGTNSLAVNGTAIFTKAKVAIYATAWPDYVFSPNYKLSTLSELEEYIQLNKHLPEVPTAAEVEKDGIDLGDNQTLLLKKVEELTLIVIELNKKIEKLEKNSKGDIEK